MSSGGFFTSAEPIISLSPQHDAVTKSRKTGWSLPLSSLWQHARSTNLDLEQARLSTIRKILVLESENFHIREKGTRDGEEKQDIHLCCRCV